MDTNLWKSSYPKLPRFACPRCGEGRLVKKGKADKGFGIFEHEPNWVTEGLEEHELRGEQSFGRFWGVLRCDIETCDEPVAISGDYHHNYDTSGAHSSNDWHVETTSEFTIKSLVPMPPIIDVPPTLSDECRLHIWGAGNLFFVDLGACANRLRAAVEALMDHLQVPRKGIRRGGSRGNLDLSERIDEFDKVKPGHKDALDSLRLVGNVGSHEGVADFDYVVHCFELLEAALDDLVANKKGRLSALAQTIIANKGRPPP